MKIGGFVNPFSQNGKYGLFKDSGRCEGGFTAWPQERPEAELGKFRSGVRFGLRDRGYYQPVGHHHCIPQGGADAQGPQEQGARI